jgi:hypothetical protein
MKSAGTVTATLEDFREHAGPLDRPAGTLSGSRGGILVVTGLLCVAAAVYTATTLGWLASPATPTTTQPLTGMWSCSLAGESVGTLSVDGWTYDLGSGQAGAPKDGLFKRVVFGKYREEFLKVEGGTLAEKFGVNLGYHYHIADKPEALIFSIGPGSGIHCTRT